MVAVSVSAAGDRNIVTVPAGAVLSIEAEAMNRQSGLVFAKWEDQTVSVFIQDLRARSDANHIPPPA